MAECLRQLLEKKDIIVAPGCHDPLSAMIAESIGFKAVYLGGWAVGAHLAITEPLTTLSEMANVSRYIASAVRIPLIVDADAGFGDIPSAQRTVREFERAGVAAIHIEDQVVPKRVHYHKGVIHLIPEDEMILKIKVALKARSSREFVVIARTDAGRNKGEDFKHAIERANRYAETGADMLMVFPRNMEEVEMAGRSIRAPLMYVASEGLGRPILPPRDLQDLGYKMVVYPLSSVIAASKAVKEIYSSLMETGRTGLAPEGASAFAAEIQRIIAIPELISLEELAGKA